MQPCSPLSPLVPEGPLLRPGEALLVVDEIRVVFYLGLDVVPSRPTLVVPILVGRSSKSDPGADVEDVGLDRSRPCWGGLGRLDVVLELHDVFQPLVGAVELVSSNVLGGDAM